MWVTVGLVGGGLDSSASLPSLEGAQCLAPGLTLLVVLMGPNLSSVWGVALSLFLSLEDLSQLWFLQRPGPLQALCVRLCALVSPSTLAVSWILGFLGFS